MRHRVTNYSVRAIKRDMRARGWSSIDLARVAGLSPSRLSRFLTCRVQSPKTAAAIARAFGYQTPERYLTGGPR